MKKKWLAVLISLVMMISLAGCGGAPANAPADADNKAGQEVKTSGKPLKVTLPTWTGYGPIFLAKEKGFFEAHGVDVEISVIGSLPARKQALAGGQVDGMATAQDVQVTLVDAGVPVQVVWLLDDSFGGDGILVKNEIQNAADLKGKKVAFEVGSTSHLLLLTALKQAGLTDKDVEVVPMSAGDAGTAFMAGQVDAAVTWEPYLTQGSKANGKILLSTKDLPGIILDSVSFRTQVIEERPQDVQAFVAGLADAMEYWKEHKDESDQIMADGLGIELAEFTATVPGLKFFDKEDNKRLFGTLDAKGDIYNFTENDINFYKEQKLIENAPKAEDLINSTFVEAL